MELLGKKLASSYTLSPLHLVHGHCVFVCVCIGVWVCWSCLSAVNGETPTQRAHEERTEAARPEMTAKTSLSMISQ